MSVLNGPQKSRAWGRGKVVNLNTVFCDEEQHLVIELCSNFGLNIRLELDHADSFKLVESLIHCYPEFKNLDREAFKKRMFQLMKESLSAKENDKLEEKSHS